MRRHLPAVLRDAGGDGLAQIGRMLRRLHDAVGDFCPPAGAVWLQGAVPVRGGEIVCHGDLGGWNTVWRDGRLVGFIDWDFAEPRRPIDDLAEVAWWLVPLAPERLWQAAGFEREPDRVARLVQLCAA
jgi:Ser/Thr protein kinase RdoA (MazF antagonist)